MMAGSRLTAKTHGQVGIVYCAGDEDQIVGSERSHPLDPAGHGDRQPRDGCDDHHGDGHLGELIARRRKLAKVKRAEEPEWRHFVFASLGMVGRKD